MSGFFLCSQPDEQCDLRDQNGGDTKGELDVLGLMAAVVHTGQCADAAADGCNTHQGRFRNPPCVALGFDLVHKHKQEACRIDYDEVQKDDAFNRDHVHFPFWGDCMKKLLVLMLMILLCGCGAQETFETVADEMVLPVLAQPREILLTLPEETLLPAMESDGRTLYLCNGYDVAVQTVPSGDLDGTIREICGFGAEELTVMETTSGDCRCFEFVWTAATDFGEQVGRAQILDDGNYHYVLTAMASAEKALDYQEIWNGLFETFGVV